MGEVIKIEFMTKHDISAEEMLNNIATLKPKHAFVIVWPEDGSEPTFHSSTGDAVTILYRIREFEHSLFSGDFK